MQQSNENASQEVKHRDELTRKVWETMSKLFKLLCAPTCSDADLVALNAARKEALEAFRSRYCNSDATHYIHLVLVHSDQLQKYCMENGCTLYHYQQEGWEAMNLQDRVHVNRSTCKGARVGRKPKTSKATSESSPTGSPPPISADKTSSSKAEISDSDDDEDGEKQTEDSEDEEGSESSSEIDESEELEADVSDREP